MSVRNDQHIALEFHCMPAACVDEVHSIFIGTHEARVMGKLDAESVEFRNQRIRGSRV